MNMLSLFESVSLRNQNQKKQQDRNCEYRSEPHQHDRYELNSLRKDYASISLDILQKNSQTSIGHHHTKYQNSRKTNISIAHDEQLFVVTEKEKSISLYNKTLNRGILALHASNFQDHSLNEVELNDSLNSDNTSYYSAQSSPVPSPESSPTKPLLNARFSMDSKSEISQKHERASSNKKFPMSSLNYCSPIQTPSRRSVTFSSSVTTTTFQSPIKEKKPPLSKISFTPDGLKPRSSVDEIRARLRLPTASLAGLPPFDPTAVPISKPYSLTKKCSMRNDYTDDDDDEDTDNEYSHSFSKSSVSDLSPIRVHSSIESHSISSFTFSALSPRITRGSAMTAVGALVADAEASTSNHDSSFLSYNSSSVPFDEYINRISNDSIKSFSKKHKTNIHSCEKSEKKTKNSNVLPPKEWMIQDNSNRISLNSRSFLSEAYHSTNRLHDYGNYTKNSSESPGHSRSFSSDGFGSADDSPSSFSHTWRYYEKSYERLPDVPHPSDESPTLMKTYTDLNTTYDSRHGLFDDHSSSDNSSKRGTYDFNIIDGSQMINHIKSTTKSKNLRTQPEFIVTGIDDGASQISSMSTITTFTFDRSIISNVDKDRNVKISATNNVYNKSSDKCEDSLPELSEFVLDKNIAKEKYKKTKRKETILVELVRRLQDDRFLVVEVEDVRENMDRLAGDISIKGKESFFVKTPLDQDGIIMGYQQKKKVKLRGSLKRFILKLEEDHIHEIQSDRESSLNEEDTRSYQLSERIQTMDESNLDLIRALLFVSSVVKTAVKMDEKGSKKHNISSGNSLRKRWRANRVLREAIDAYKLSVDSNGELSSPNSMWSSPSRSITPNTSNRSNTTTLTSSKRSSMNESQSICDPSKLRKTLEVVAALLQKMSLACSKIMIADQSSKDTFILATEELKRCYLQLMSIRTSDIYALYSCFVQESDFKLNEAPQTFNYNEIDVPILHNPPSIVRTLNSSKVASTITQPQQASFANDDMQADVELCSKISSIDIVSSKCASLLDGKREDEEDKFDSNANNHVSLTSKEGKGKNYPNDIDENCKNIIGTSQSFHDNSVIRSLNFFGAGECDPASSQATIDKHTNALSKSFFPSQTKKIEYAEHRIQCKETKTCMEHLIDKPRNRRRYDKFVIECKMEKKKSLNIDDNQILSSCDQTLADIYISPQSMEKQVGKSNHLKEIELSVSTCDQMQDTEERDSNENSMVESEMETNIQIKQTEIESSSQNDVKTMANTFFGEKIKLLDVVDVLGSQCLEKDVGNFRQDQNTPILVEKESRDSNPTIDIEKANMKESNIDEPMNDVCKNVLNERIDSLQSMKCKRNNDRRYFAVENECIPR